MSESDSDLKPESAFLPEPFTVQASPEELADLHARLGATRWPDAPENAGWSLGTDLAFLRDLGYSTVPEPSTGALLAAALMLVGRRVRTGGRTIRQSDRQRARGRFV